MCAVNPETTTFAAIPVRELSDAQITSACARRGWTVVDRTIRAHDDRLGDEPQGDVVADGVTYSGAWTGWLRQAFTKALAATGGKT